MKKTGKKVGLSMKFNIESTNLWNDTFTIELTITENAYQNKKEHKTEKFSGSLKGAIRYVLNLNYKGNITAVFYASNGEYLKEIGC